MRTEEFERVEVRWTPRQKEVLNLLAQGHTNPEIAQRLGLSLDGAKWHVSEVMSTLGVRSREAAAAYWRHEQRPLARIGRAIQGLALGAPAKWAAAGVAATVATGIFAAVLLVLWDQGSEGGPADPTTPETFATLSPEVGTVTAAPTSPDPPLSQAGVIGEINGEALYELVPAPERELPAGSALYTTITCSVCVGGELYRFVQDETGQWVRERLSPDSLPDIEGGYPVGSFISDGTGRFAGLWCIPEGGRGCGKTHDGTTDTRRRAVIVSDDGGITWSQIAETPAGSSVVQFSGGEVLVALHNGPGTEPAYRLYPSGEPVNASTLLQHETSLALPNGMLRLQPEDSSTRLTNDGPSSIWSYLRAGSGQRELLAFPGSRLTLGVAVAPELVAGGSYGRNEQSQLLDPPRGLGGFPRTAVLVDLGQRTVSPIAHVNGDDENDIFDAEAYSPGPILRVSNSETCLNLREAPSNEGTVLMCLKDNVFLEDEGTRVDADGQSWARVKAPGGVLGWASMEFLERVGPPE